MKKLVLAVLLVLQVTSRGVHALEIIGKVVGVSDGDTIAVMNNGKAEKIRLSGVDCPEKTQAFGSRAKQFTSQAVFGEVVKVEYQKRDRYGRILGDVLMLRGQNLSEELLKAGMAWHYRQYSKSVLLQSLEDEARAEGLGLWSDKHATPPWEFRKERKKR